MTHRQATIIILYLFVPSCNRIFRCWVGRYWPNDHEAGNTIPCRFTTMTIDLLWSVTWFTDWNSNLCHRHSRWAFYHRTNAAPTVQWWNPTGRCTRSTTMPKRKQSSRQIIGVNRHEPVLLKHASWNRQKAWKFILCLPHAFPDFLRNK